MLTGHCSQSLDESATGSGGWTRFVMDDSADAARKELSTSRAASRLQLGALLHQQGNERLAPRGHGLSLDSEAHGALRAGAGLLAGGQHLLAARCGVVLYTFGRVADEKHPNQETGIALHAATGSVHASANTGAARLAASGPGEVASTQGSVDIGSPLGVLLAAAGAALKLQPGGIEVIAPAAVKFRAGLKELTGAKLTPQANIHLPAPPEIHLSPPGPFSLRFAMQGVDDMADDASLCGQPYTVRNAEGTVISEVVISEDGKIPRIKADQHEEIYLEIGNPEPTELMPMTPASIEEPVENISPTEVIAEVTDASETPGDILEADDDATDDDEEPESV